MGMNVMCPGCPALHPACPCLSSRRHQRHAARGWGACTHSMDQLLPALLKASPYVTDDPEEADYFLPNIWTTYPIMPTKDVFDAVRAAGPWWDRNNGSGARAERVGSAAGAPARPFAPTVGGLRLQAGVPAGTTGRLGG